MMIIVYISLAIIVASLAYLGFAVFKTYKATKPSIESLQQTAARVQAKTDIIKQETDQLTVHQQQLVSDFEKKKKAVNTVVFSVKQTPLILKNAINVKPVADLERRYKARQWKNIHRNTAQTQY